MSYLVKLRSSHKCSKQLTDCQQIKIKNHLRNLCNLNLKLICETEGANYRNSLQKSTCWSKSIFRFTLYDLSPFYLENWLWKIWKNSGYIWIELSHHIEIGRKTNRKISKHWIILSFCTLRVHVKHLTKDDKLFASRWIHCFSFSRLDSRWNHYQESHGLVWCKWLLNTNSVSHFFNAL